MANAFGKDILIQAADPKAAADFYVKQLGFTITGEHGRWIDLHGDNVNLFIEGGRRWGRFLKSRWMMWRKRSSGWWRAVARL